MSKLFDQVRTQLSRISRDVQAAHWVVTSEPWGGAGLMIQDTPHEPETGEEFYAEPRYLITPYSLEISGLFLLLTEAFRPLLDSAIKIEFYGRLANAAERASKQTSEPLTAKELGLAVLREAERILDEMELGTFRYYGIAVGNSIVADP